MGSRALRSSSSRFLSTKPRDIFIRTIFSTPELSKPVALKAAVEPGVAKLAGARFHLSRFCCHDHLFISGNWRMPLVKFEKSQRSDSSILVALLPALFLGLSSTPAMAEDSSTELTETDLGGLRKIDDGSVVSNIHTSKWRVFTDNGRDLFLQGKLEDAERLFMGALQEAKEGFGERDPHVASACNNLAELYRVKKAFDKAEPLYLDAISILEESYGHDDIRVGAALHNLGQFYLIKNELDKAHACYERALKIKRRVLGEGHADYAETMYHLGKVLDLQGNEKDAEALIKDSIKILEEGGQGGSFLYTRRLRTLVQIYIKSNKLTEAINIQRKILQAMEESKGWDSLETVIAAESLALILQSSGSLNEAKELLQRCLVSRRKLLPEGHIQIAANMLHLARVELLLFNQTNKDSSKALDNAQDLLCNATRLAQQVLDKLKKQGANRKSYEVSRTDTHSQHTALLILLQALNTLSQLEVTKSELITTVNSDAEKALLDCISAFRQFGSEKGLSNFGDIKGEYLSCLKHLSSLLKPSKINSLKNSRKPTLEEVQNEIKRVEANNTKPYQR
ncbi:uncharacterized protein LOC111920622 isoform X1 [Lactuca sativa]|uniref:uncharacterized protein LOC111920622 isoform X1 n=1 Tax=Lactuca sativa TaxID=4236 RepID=UPI000CD907DF|nr:uncharacterized protein LOC111920622 isoform X1 [Lactuca sativa]